MKPANRSLVQTRVTPEMRAFVEAEAAELGVSVADWVRIQIRAAMREKKKPRRKLPARLVER